MSSSTLYRVLEPISNAATGVARARDILDSLARGSGGAPWAQLEPIGTREQFEYAIAMFPRAHVYDEKEAPTLDAFMAELVSRNVAFERAPDYRHRIDLRLGPELGDLWPLPEGIVMTLGAFEPFWRPGKTDEDNSTEAELDAMVEVLGPLQLNVSWDCAWRGLPVHKMCGLQLCLNGVWDEQSPVCAPGEFGLWISIGNNPENHAVSEQWRATCGLPLGGPQGGW